MTRAVTCLVLMLGTFALGLGCSSKAGHPDPESESTNALFETRTMLFEGSCGWLACCAKGNCSIPASSVGGACGGSCSDTVPWIARPNGNFNYGCGSCVRVCLSGTDHCVQASVWDNSVTASAIEGNLAVFNALGLSHSENSSACTGSGIATVDLRNCVATPSCASVGGTCASAQGIASSGWQCATYEAGYDASCASSSGTPYCFSDCVAPEPCASVGGTCSDAAGTTASGQHCATYEASHDASCASSGETPYCFTDCGDCRSIGGHCASGVGDLANGQHCFTRQADYDVSCASNASAPYCFADCQ